MIAKRRGSRLIYFLMSALVAWHTTAMVLAPAPQSYITQAARGVFGPYLEAFRLDNPWSFYSPGIGYGHEFRYVVEDKNGKRYNFTPLKDVSWFHPSYWWLAAWYEAISQSPRALAPMFVELVCKKHELLNPALVRLIAVTQKNFNPEDYFGGHQPLDDDFVVARELGSAPCPKQ